MKMLGVRLLEDVHKIWQKLQIKVQARNVIVSDIMFISTNQICLHNFIPTNSETE